MTAGRAWNKQLVTWINITFLFLLPAPAARRKKEDPFSLSSSPENILTSNIYCRTAAPSFLFPHSVKIGISVIKARNYIGALRNKGRKII